MPTYTFKDKRSGEINEFFMKISDLDDFKGNNPQLEQIHLAAFEIGDTIRMGLKKPDPIFRDMLKEIHKNTGGNKQYRHN